MYLSTLVTVENLKFPLIIVIRLSTKTTLVALDINDKVIFISIH